MDAFLLFISDKMVKSMVKFTNLEGKRNKADFVETYDIEMRAFVGCILFLGGMKQSMLSSTTVFDAMYGQGFVRASFSRNRFLQLLNFLRFDDKETRSARRSRDVFAPFRDFCDAFTKNLSDHYIPGPFITIDEQLVPFRGRCSFIQYLPSKPDKYGIKIFWAADAENNFPLVAEPYLGRPLGADRQINLGRNVTLRLSAPFFNSGRNVTTDNFFTDKELSDVLQNNGLTFVGTVRANKRFLPESFKNERGLQLHASSFLFQDKTTIVNYQTKRNKNVVFMCTMHHECAVAPQASKKKPDIIRFCNSTKLILLIRWLMRIPLNTLPDDGRWCSFTTPWISAPLLPVLCGASSFRTISFPKKMPGLSSSFGLLNSCRWNIWREGFVHRTCQNS